MITDTMVEAAARAICWVRCIDPDTCTMGSGGYVLDANGKSTAARTECTRRAWQDFTGQARAALEAAERAAWRPISEAERIPDQRLDLWVVPGKPMWGERGKPYREANARLSGNGKHWIDADGRYIEGVRTYDSFDPDDRSADATIVTHFRPLPSPPEAPSKKGEVP